MFEYRAVLMSMGQGSSDRAITKTELMGRSMASKFCTLTDLQG